MPNSSALQMAVNERTPGTTISMEILRDGKPETLSIKLGEFHASSEVADNSSAPSEQSTNCRSISCAGQGRIAWRRAWKSRMRNMNLALLLYASLFRNNVRIAEEVLFVLLFYAAAAMIVGTPLAVAIAAWRFRIMRRGASRGTALLSRPTKDGSGEPSHDSINV